MQVIISDKWYRDLDHNYLLKMHDMLNVDPNEWADRFKNWNYMKLKDDLVRGEDFVLVSLTVWLKLVKAFGGAPEIPIFLINNQLSENSSEEPDLKPIKVEIKVYE